MTGFFDKMLGRGGQKGSSATAKDRLKMVLVHDRIRISPEKMREMKAEIIAVIARYLPEVDAESVDIMVEQSDRFSNKLVAEIPFSSSRNVTVNEDENDDLGASPSEGLLPIDDDPLFSGGMDDTQPHQTD